MNNIDVVKGYNKDNINFINGLNIDLINESELFLNILDASSEININVLENLKVKLYLTLSYEEKSTYNINVSENASLEIVCIQKNSNDNNFITNVKANAECEMYFVDLCNECTNNFETNLVGDFAKFNLRTASINLKSQVSNISINTKHLSKATTSNATSRSVVFSEGKYVNSTVGFIEKGCSLSKCHQDTKAIVLGKTAMAECDPVLLIDEYDVEASHAAAVGQINEDDLYYLQSRGLSYEQCLVLLVNGFLISITEKISNDELKEYLIEQISNTLTV